MITVPPSPVLVYHGCALEFSLTCSAEGLPLPSITWMWNDMEREFSEGFTDDNGKLVNVSNTLHATMNRVDSVFYINSTVGALCAEYYTAICRASNYLGGGSKLSESELQSGFLALMWVIMEDIRMSSVLGSTYSVKHCTFSPLGSHGIITFLSRNKFAYK